MLFSLHMLDFFMSMYGKNHYSIQYCKVIRFQLKQINFKKIIPSEYMHPEI